LKRFDWNNGKGKFRRKMGERRLISKNFDEGGIERIKNRNRS
jgi:hypothetical protein